MGNVLLDGLFKFVYLLIRAVSTCVPAVLVTLVLWYFSSRYGLEFFELPGTYLDVWVAFFGLEVLRFTLLPYEELLREGVSEILGVTVSAKPKPITVNKSTEGG